MCDCTIQPFNHSTYPCSRERTIFLIAQFSHLLFNQLMHSKEATKQHVQLHHAVNQLLLSEPTCVQRKEGAPGSIAAFNQLLLDGTACSIAPCDQKGTTNWITPFNLVQSLQFNGHKTKPCACAGQLTHTALAQKNSRG